jgi:hypothetical protein
MSITTTTRFDTRTVAVVLDGAEPMPHWYGDRRFVPRRATVTIDLLTDRVTGVRLDGPALTKTGKEHSVTEGDWHWSGSFLRDGDRVWPPADAPEAALVAVEHALTTLSVSRP